MRIKQRLSGIGVGVALVDRNIPIMKISVRNIIGNALVPIPHKAWICGSGRVAIITIGKKHRKGECIKNTIAAIIVCLTIVSDFYALIGEYS